MRKRFVLLWTPLVVAMALLLPSATAAATIGKIEVVSGYCSGNNTVNATFKITKFSGVYATRLTLSVKGQGDHGGSWVTDHNYGTYSKTVNTSARASLSRSFSFNPGHSGRHRIHVVGKIWNGNALVSSRAINAGVCQ